MRHRSTIMVVLVLFAVLALAVTYSALAVYKAYDYTNTPRQDTSTIAPPDDGLTYQDVSFATAANDGVTLSGWFVPHPGSHRVLVLVHGRYANRMQMEPLVKPLWDQGYNLLLFDLRGHGKSNHVESTYGISEQWDVAGAARYAQSKGFAPESIGVIGWSLGGASTLMAMGSSNDFTAAVTDSAHANSDPLLARNPLQPGLRLAMNWFRGVDLAKVRPVDSIRGLQNRSIMLIHGEDDRVVPLSQEKLLEQAGGNSVKQVWIVPGAGHVGSFALHADEYIQRVAAFFNAALK
ncbi:MAG: alpha/beta fold hydrolase [Nitrolancea sp.]